MFAVAAHGVLLRAQAFRVGADLLFVKRAIAKTSSFLVALLEDRLFEDPAGAIVCLDQAFCTQDSVELLCDLMELLEVFKRLRISNPTSENDVSAIEDLVASVILFQCVILYFH